MLAFVATGFGLGGVRMSACLGLAAGGLLRRRGGGTDGAAMLFLSRVGFFGMLLHLIPFTRAFAKLSTDAWLRTVRVARELFVFLLC
jgi:hypothetical protein